MHTSERTHRGRTLFLLLLAAAFGLPSFFGLYTAFDLFGLTGALGFLFVIALILLIAWLVHLLRTFAPEAAAFLRSTGSAVGHALAAQPALHRFVVRLAPLGGFVRRRFDPSTPRGLFLTGGLTVTAVLTMAFGSLFAQVVGHGVITQVDVRVASLSDALHQGGPVRASTFFTSIGGAAVRIPLSILVFGVLWLRRPALRPVIGLVAVLVLAPALSDLFRVLVRRPRPSVGAIALPESFSFPSGHAAAAAGSCGYLAYLAVRATRRLSAHVAISLLAAALIIGVAYSRVVLGFHWASDVLAGTVLGLAVAAGAATWVDVTTWRNVGGDRRGARWPAAAAVLAVALASLTLARSIADPLHAPPLVPLAITTLPNAVVDASTVARLPLRSETLTGRAMEPVSLVFVGSRDQLEAAFGAAGWQEADPVNIHTILRLYGAGLHHRAYASAPVTPAFLAGRPQDLAFERAIDVGSVSKRHHIRIWASGFTLADGTPIWVATASLDDRVEIKFPSILPNHHISPAIDLERDFIARSLIGTGLVGGESRLQAVPPELGSNAAGDPFFTYGVAVVLDLR
jgi:membrane-associated phospholipid phosphatase